ncbi:hypothetical protein EVAR_94562_1 [Eumeta japonica]|uniref:Uncharacterized protein n=1 Tax=Eumeta variegata TaxID=151549 RepID=A0A4C1UW82_EUMVA|nr:hypothetical protein EVAR_94562_1 [Eumeta japonica]
MTVDARIYLTSVSFVTQVAGVVGRADVLACVFYLSSILVYHGECDQEREGCKTGTENKINVELTVKSELKSKIGLDYPDIILARLLDIAIEELITCHADEAAGKG